MTAIPTAARAAAQMRRRGEPINPSDHQCGYEWCEGTMWTGSHLTSTALRTTGRDGDVIDELEVTVMVTYDETEDSRPRILLHVGGAEGRIDFDVSPTAAEATHIAIRLLSAAVALDEWGGRR